MYGKYNNLNTVVSYFKLLNFSLGEYKLAKNRLQIRINVMDELILTRNQPTNFMSGKVSLLILKVLVFENIASNAIGASHIYT